MSWNTNWMHSSWILQHSSTSSEWARIHHNYSSEISIFHKFSLYFNLWNHGHSVYGSYFVCVCVHMAVRAKIKSSMLVLITHISQFAKALNGSHYFSLYQLKLIKMQDNCHCNAHSVAFHFRITRLILGHDWSITTGNPLKLSWIHTHTNTDTLKRFPGSRF